MNTFAAYGITNCAHDADRAVLARIHEPGINIAVWERARTIPVSVLERVLLGLAGELRASGCVTLGKTDDASPS
ncbi:MAG: hypothetical protein JNL43_08400 [Flavobacteriales bacterium]|nr:hypothetical protein [Flavobacteriales bacterium]